MKGPVVTFIDTGRLPATSRAASRAFWMAAVGELKAHPGEVGMCGVWSPGIAHWIRKGAYAYFLPGRAVSNVEAYMARHWDVVNENVRVEGGRRVGDLLITWTGAGCECRECE